MKVYLVTARDEHYDDHDYHVVAVYSSEEVAARIAETFNDTVSAAEDAQLATGKGRIETRYEQRLREVLKGMGDENADVCWNPYYGVEEFEIDPDRP